VAGVFVFIKGRHDVLGPCASSRLARQLVETSSHPHRAAVAFRSLLRNVNSSILRQYRGHLTVCLTWRCDILDSAIYTDYSRTRDEFRDTMMLSCCPRRFSIPGGIFSPFLLLRNCSYIL
jgi:hypothetical protein